MIPADVEIYVALEPIDLGWSFDRLQGSGKSLTMLWLALKLRRDPRVENPLLVVVTDRKDLDDQITTTFRNCGFPHPEQAASVRDLKTLLSGPSGRTVLTTVQKFQDAAEGLRRPAAWRAALRPRADDPPPRHFAMAAGGKRGQMPSE